MAQLTKDTPRIFEAAPFQSFGDIPVAAGSNGVLFEGMALAQNGSIGATFVSGSNDVFAGFCEKKVDNTGGAALALNVRLREKGMIRIPVVGSGSASNVGATVYANDSNVFTLTSTSGTSIGKVHRWVTSTTCIVAFEAASLRSI